MNKVVYIADEINLRPIREGIGQAIVTAARAKVSHDHARPWSYRRHGAIYKIVDLHGGAICTTDCQAVAVALTGAPGVA